MFMGLLATLTVLAHAPAETNSFAMPPEVRKAYADAPEREIQIAWQGTRFILHRDYDSILSLLKEYAREDPQSLLPSMGTMFTYHVRMVENFDFRFAKEFESAAQENTQVMKRYFREKKASRWQLLIAGASFGMRGMMEARRQHWLKSTSLGIEAMGYMRKVKFEGPGLPPLYDLYYGSGMYHYWTSWARQKSLILSFLPDRKEQGLHELGICAEKAALSGPIASYVLAYLYGQEGRIPQALKRMQQLIGEYPNNIIFRSLYARLLLGNKQTDQGIAVMEKLLQEEPQMVYLGFYLGKALYQKQRETERVQKFMEDYWNEPDVIRPEPLRNEAAFILVELYAMRGEHDRARHYIQQIRENQLPREWRKRFQDYERTLSN